MSKPAGLVAWDQQDAEAAFAEVVRRAQTSGPLLVIAQSGPPIVIVLAEEFLARPLTRPLTLKDPLLPGAELVIERSDMPTVPRPPVEF